MDYWVSLYSPASLQAKSKSMKKHLLQTIASTSRALTAITYYSFGALQLNKQKLLLLGWIRCNPDFNCWPLPSPRIRHVKKLLIFFFKICNYLPNVFQFFMQKNVYCTIMFGFRRSGYKLQLIQWLLPYTSGQIQLFSPFRSNVNASTPSEFGFQNLELKHGCCVS